LKKELNSKKEYIAFIEQQLNNERQKMTVLKQQIEEVKSSFNTTNIQKDVHAIQNKTGNIKAVLDKSELMKLQSATMVCA